MNLFVLILQICLLGVIIWQDFKNRSISWFLIPLFLLVVVAKGLFAIHFNELLEYTIINLVLVIINLIGVTLLVSLKEKKITNIVDSYLGLGDILFFLVLTVVFSPINFVAFYFGSIVLLTVIYGLSTLFHKNKQQLVPLAGGMSILLIITLLVEQAQTTFSCYNDILVIGE